MSEQELVKKPLRQYLMHLSFENQTYADYQIELRAKNIARDIFEDADIGGHSPFGTIMFFDVHAAALREQKPRGELNGDELLLRKLTLMHFEDIE